MTDSIFDRWLLGAGGLVALLVAASALNFQNTRRLSEDAEWVSHTHEVMATLEEVHGHLREAEAAQRTHLIVGGDNVPAEFHANVDLARRQMARLNELTEDNPQQQAQLPAIQQRIDELAAFWANTMAVRQQQGFDAARQIVEAGQSLRLMAELRGRLLELESAERLLLRDRSVHREQTYRWAIGTGLISSVAGVIGVVALLALLRRHLAARKAAQRVIAEQAERLRTTLASIGDAVIATDTKGQITNINIVGESLTGWTKEQAVGQPLDVVFRIVNEKTRQPVENPATRALAQGVIVGLANHTLLIARDGSERLIDDSAAPIRCQDGEIVGCVLVFRDVTERRHLENESAGRLAAARLLSSIVESSEDAIISKSLDGVIQSWNAAAQRLFGFTAQQAIGRHISLIIPQDRLAEEDRIIASLKAGHRIEHHETVRLRSDGRPISVSLTISPVRNEAGEIVGASTIVRDVSERKRVEAERQKFVTLVESSTDFIAMCDLQGTPFYINQAGLQAVGLDSLEQARETPVREFFFPEDQPGIIEEFLPSVLKNGHGEVEVRFRHFKTGDPRWMDYKVLTITDDAGQPIALATVSQDVTERRQMEDNLRRLAASLSEADHRKDEFLATLAHELRNPLAPIRNALQVLRLAEDPEAHAEAHAMMQRQLEQMVRLVDDLLDVSRITRGTLELRREPIPLSAVVNTAVETSRPLIDRMNHQLTVTLPEQTIILDADATRLAQVFSNLLNNSAKYMDKGGRIWLTADQNGNELVVSVRDTGIGIAVDHLPRIFEMFSQVDRSLERSQGGLGIGLTLVRRLVELHGGRIEAHSEGLQKGALFTIWQPIILQPSGASQVADTRAPESRQAALRILIVDDNRDSSDSLAMLLRMTGNETRTAYDGEQGIEIAGKFLPHVVLLDIGLPKLNGYEACRRIREQPGGPQMVRIAMTGWGQDEDRRRSHDAGFDHHLVKPLDPQALLRLLDSVQRFNE
ncbi:MAG: PAS domain S-box protein [Planctomycetaceae bacterium]